MDTILDFASKDTALPIKHGIKRRLTSREEVVSYLQKNMAEDKDVQRLRRTDQRARGNVQAIAHAVGREVHVQVEVEQVDQAFAGGREVAILEVQIEAGAARCQVRAR